MTVLALWEAKRLFRLPFNWLNNHLREWYPDGPGRLRDHFVQRLVLRLEDSGWLNRSKEKGESDDK